MLEKVLKLISLPCDVKRSADHFQSNNFSTEFSRRTKRKEEVDKDFNFNDVNFHTQPFEQTLTNKRLA